MLRCVVFCCGVVCCIALHCLVLCCVMTTYGQIMDLVVVEVQSVQSGHLGDRIWNDSDFVMLCGEKGNVKEVREKRKIRILLRSASVKELKEIREKG